MRRLFDRFSEAVSRGAGTPWAFALALAITFVWALTGPMFGFSQTWQLVINTGTTIITFLMVFVIQNTQNRGDKALQIKLDELLEALNQEQGIDIEDLSEKELDRLQQQFHELRKQRDGRERDRDADRNAEAPKR